MGYYGGLLMKKDVSIYGDPVKKLGDVNGDGLTEILTPELEKADADAFIVFDADVEPSGEVSEDIAEPVMLFEGETRGADEISVQHAAKDAGDVNGDGFAEVAEESAEQDEPEMIAQTYKVYGDEAGKEAPEADGETVQAVRDTTDSFVFDWSGDEKAVAEEIAEIAIIGQTPPPGAWDAGAQRNVETFDDLFAADDAAFSISFDGF